MIFMPFMVKECPGIAVRPHANRAAQAASRLPLCVSAALREAISRRLWPSPSPLRPGVFAPLR